MVAYFQTLNSLHITYPRGLPNDGKATQDRLLVQNLLVPPFIVPAALDRLARSRFCSVTEVVPGEADAYCAHLAQETGATILTNDSDLAVFDLGPEGAVAFLHSLADKNETPSACGGLHARIWQYRDISQRLGADMQRFAYEVKRNPPIRLTQALVNAKGKLADTTGFNEFLVEYDLRGTPQPPSGVGSAGAESGYIDPRLNELTIQIIDPQVEKPHMYLPVLLSDPSRATAWQPSCPIRVVLYSLLITAFRLANNHPLRILEHDARRVSRPTPVATSTILSEEIKGLTSSILSHTTFNRFALCTALSSLNNTPSVSEMYPKSFRSWHHIHLLAQVHGILYCLRLLKQVLQLVMHTNAWSTAPPTESETHLTPAIVEYSRVLYTELRSLPDLAELFPRGIDREDFLEAVVKVQEHDQPDDQEEVNESHSTAILGDFTLVCDKKSRRKATKTADAITRRPTEASGYYSILGLEE